MADQITTEADLDDPPIDPPDGHPGPFFGAFARQVRPAPLRRYLMPRCLRRRSSVRHPPSTPTMRTHALSACVHCPHAFVRISSGHGRSRRHSPRQRGGRHTRGVPGGSGPTAADTRAVDATRSSAPNCVYGVSAGDCHNMRWAGSSMPAAT
jgi:hypothetical protein